MSVCLNECKPVSQSVFAVYFHDDRYNEGGKQVILLLLSSPDAFI